MVYSQITAEEALAMFEARGWWAERSTTLKSCLSKIALVRHYSPGEPLYLYGDPPNGIFGLIDGGLDITIPRSDGLDLTVHRAEAGFWVGDLGLFSGQPRLVSVVAAVRTTVIHLPDHALRAIVERHPEFFPEFYALTYENIRVILSLLGNLAITPSEARVAARLMMHAELEHVQVLKVSQAKLAELVGLSSATLQRALKRLQDERLVRVGYGQIEILDRAGLLRICNP